MPTATRLPQHPNTVNGPGAVDVFTWATVRDADGDESTTTITIDAP